MSTHTDAKETPVPWKDPHNWLQASVMAPILAFVLATLRATYFDENVKWPRRMVESALCAMIALSASYGVDAMGIHGDWKVVIAAVVALVGVEYIRGLAKRFLDKKVG